MPRASVVCHEESRRRGSHSFSRAPRRPDAPFGASRPSRRGLAPGLAIAVALTLGAAPLAAQRQEFTRQIILVTNFESGAGTDAKAGRKAADEVRDRLEKLVNDKQADVIPGYAIRQKLELSGIQADSALHPGDVRMLAREVRADEYVLGTVRKVQGGVQVSGHLMLVRDPRLRQPIPATTAGDVDAAAAAWSRGLAQARLQLIPMRRCENALRDGKGAEALRFAREGAATWPKAVLARTCLLWALRTQGGTADELVSISREILAEDPAAFHALEASAIALDSLRRRDESAAMWVRVAETDTTNVELVERVVWTMLDRGMTRQAQPFIVRMSRTMPEEVRFTRLVWRASWENRDWPLAVATGERLLAGDSTAVTDPVFFQRLATAYRSAGEQVKSIQTVARGVASFPKDQRLYALYAQYVRAEADTVIPRGLAIYPQSAELQALRAQELRARGRKEEALDATRKAVALDSSLAQGELMVAQAEFELGRPDSALTALHRAVGKGEDTTSVAQFALSKGNALYRAANGTKNRDDYRLAMRFLAYADSLRPTPQSKFLLGASAYSVTQSALSEAPKLADSTQKCALSKLGAEMLPVAKGALEAGQEVSAEGAKQLLEYLGQLEPFAQRQVAAFCTPGS